MDSKALERLMNNEEEYRLRSIAKLDTAEAQVKKSSMTSDERTFYGNLLQQELDAKKDLARENTVKFQSKVEAESNKKKKHRRDDYEENLLKYGGGVTMETAAMQRNLVRFQKSWKKEMKSPDLKGLVDKLDLSDELFQIMQIKGSKQHIDIKKIMHNLHTLRAVRDNENNILEGMKDLTGVQKSKLMVGLSVLPQLESAVASLLQSHALDESGNVAVKRKDHEQTSENTGISEIISEKEMMEHSLDVEEAVVRYKTALGQAFAKMSENQNLKFSAQQTREIKQHTMSQKKRYDKHDDRRNKFVGMMENRFNDRNPGRELQKEERKGVERLLWNCLGCYAELDRLTMELEAKKEILAVLEAKKKPTNDEVSFREKLKLSTLADSYKAEYKNVEHQSRRLERMLRGVCEDKPMTIAMRMELAGEYGIIRYQIGEFEQVPHHAPERELVMPTDAKAMEKRQRLEKRADRFQNYLGARSISSLSDSEKKDNAEVIEFIEQYDSQRKAKIGELEQWLETNYQDLKNSLALENEEVKEDPAWKKRLESSVTWIGRILEYIGTVQGIASAGGQIDLGSTAYDDSKYKSVVEFDKKWMSGIGSLISLYKKFKSPEKLGKMSTEEKTLAILNFIQASGKVAQSVLNQIKNFADLEKVTKENFNKYGKVLGVTGAALGLYTNGRNLYKANARRYKTADQKKIFESINDEENKGDLQRLKVILDVAGKTAKRDMWDSGIKTVTSAGKGVNTFFKVPGVSEGIWAVEKLTERFVASSKARLRRQYVTDNYEQMFKKIKETEAGKHLSDRDIKHTFLKFLGTKSGKRSEAGIRKIATDSSYLLDRTNGNDNVKNYKKDTLLSMGFKEKKLDKTERKDVMKVMGATDSQSSSPLLASNRIYREQLGRSKDYKEGAFGRGMRHIWRFFTRA